MSDERRSLSVVMPPGVEHSLSTVGAGAAAATCKLVMSDDRHALSVVFPLGIEPTLLTVGAETAATTCKVGEVCSNGVVTDRGEAMSLSSENTSSDELASLQRLQ